MCYLCFICATSMSAGQIKLADSIWYCFSFIVIQTTMQKCSSASQCRGDLHLSGWQFIHRQTQKKREAEGDKDYIKKEESERKWQQHVSVNATSWMPSTGWNQKVSTCSLWWRSKSETMRKTEGVQGERDVWDQGGEAFSTWDCPRWTQAAPSLYKQPLLPPLVSPLDLFVFL